MTKAKPPRGFRAAYAKAEQLARDSEQLASLLEKARTKAQEQGDKLEKARVDFMSLMRLVKAYTTGQYRRVPWTSVVMALTAVVYFVNPFDVIPDFLAGVGYLDDATVIAFCLSGMRKDLAEFLTWEAGGKPDA